MNIAELGKKYKLVSQDKEGNAIDLWKCHNNWILTHNAVTKIAHMERIKLVKIESIYQSETSCRFLITMIKEDEEGVVVASVTSVGEADTRNSKNNYYGSMAEKRGIDRCVLKLIKAYEYGVYSEVEADDFKKESK